MTKEEKEDQELRKRIEKAMKKIPAMLRKKAKAYREHQKDVKRFAKVTKELKRMG